MLSLRMNLALIIPRFKWMSFPTGDSGAAIFPLEGQVFCRSEHGRIISLRYVTLGYEFRVPLDKNEGVVNTQMCRPVF